MIPAFAGMTQPMLSTPLTKNLLHTTENYIKALEKGGIKTVEDMLMLFPRDYEDRTNVLDSFSLVNLKESNTILVTLVSLDTTRTGNGKLLTKAILEDKNGFLAEAVWFNRKYLASQLQYSAGKKVLVSGKVKYNYGKVSFSSPEIEVDLSKASGAIVPIYPDTNYIPGRWIESKMGNLQKYIENVEENLPQTILKKYGFLPRKEALMKLHFPKTKHEVEQAHRRLAYEELYGINYQALSKKYAHFAESEGKSLSIPLDAEFVKEIFTHVPFELTGGQKIALFQVLKDMQDNHAMQRLLEGDVGTGKTIVAFIAIIHAIKQSEKLGKKIQVAVMAPTEILARQHFQSTQNILLEFGLTSHLLVGSTTAKQKSEIKSALKSGNLDVIVGTHALVQEDVFFQNLGFVIIDEQHRFGVRQREVLEQGWGNTSEYIFDTHISETEFAEIVHSVENNGLNKRKIQKQDYCLVRKHEKMLGFIRIYHLESEDYEISNLWIDESARGDKLGKKLMSFAIKEKGKKGNLFLTCKASLEEYYRGLGFEEVFEFPARFQETLDWAAEQGIPYKVYKLGKFTPVFYETLVPHNLNMTATPIPRTLALTLYGDQDLSIISEYPKGRKIIHTKVAKNDAERAQIELFIRNELEKGRQVFWISPLVEESEKIDLANAVNTYESLLSIFAPFQVGLLHGKMTPKEKEHIMRDFKENKIQVLSSTSVVEVGVDVPNASIMCIEGAERFGLSQLHQFRGRVGRGEYQSYCYLFPTTGQATDRLRAMEKTNNGFELSEIDLEIRGPGEVYGVRQSGLPDLKIADITDLELVSQIREDIEEMLQKKKD